MTRSTRLTHVTLIVTLVASPLLAQARAAADLTSLEAVVREQMERIDALEREVRALRGEVARLGGPPPGAEAGAPRPAAPTESDGPAVAHPVEGGPEEAVDLPSPAAADLPPMSPRIQGYGSLRVVGGIDSEGRSEARSNFSRVGLRGEAPFAEGWSGFARLELGVNLGSGERAILGGADPGAPIGQGSNALSSRLGYLGMHTPFGSVSWGKQWAVYSDVSGFTDVFHAFGGDAGGTYAAGTDGAISGTGRADKALQYRYSRGIVSLGLQAQNRSITERDQNFADTFGGSMLLGVTEGLTLGLAYNEVRDGVDLPNANQSKLGDRAAIVALRWNRGPLYAAAAWSAFEQHEVDDLGRFYDGDGLELALIYRFGERWAFEAGFNELRPDRGQAGAFRLRYGLAGMVLGLDPDSEVFFGLRLEDSRNADGSKGRESALSLGYNYTF